VNVTATDAHNNTTHRSFTVAVVYKWTGFFSPVDNPTVVNYAKAGSAVPVKFSLGGNMGLDIFASGYPRVMKFVCGTGLIFDAIEETVTAGQSTLNYGAAANQYVYVWKTETSWKGTNQQLQLLLKDGTTHTAWFQFTK
jgi:hypothetical protein